MEWGNIIIKYQFTSFLNDRKMIYDGSIYHLIQVMDTNSETLILSLFQL